MKKLVLLSLLLLLGSLAATAANYREALTARLTTTSITVTGTAEKPGWIGVSVYGPNDKKGWHQVRKISAGPINQVFRVSLSPGGRYEMALWETKVLRAQCPTHCSWCKLNGFHMEGLRAYHTGQITRAR